MTRSGAERLTAELERLGARALVVLASNASEPDLAPFARGARLGEAFVVVPRGGAPRLGYWTPMERDEAAASGLALLSPEQLELARLARENPEPPEYLAAVLGAALERCGIAPGLVALAGSWPAGVLVEASDRMRSDGWIFVAGTDASRRARKSKSEEEIAEVGRVARGTVDGIRAVADRLAGAVVRDGELWSEGERLTVARLKREVALVFAAHGLSEPRENIVAPGGEGGVPHSSGTPDRVLRAGESLIVDLFPKGRLFADCTRTFCLGVPPEPIARAHAEVLSALDLARSRAVAGRRGWEIQQAVCALFGACGRPTPVSHAGTLRGYVHNLGHGVGYELHELPSFKESVGADDGILEAGDVITLEPGLYEPGAGGFGVRLEDLYVVRPEGLENLTPLPYDLDPRAWPD